MSRFARTAVLAATILLAAAGVAQAHGRHADGPAVDRAEKKAYGARATAIPNPAATYSASDYDGKVLSADAADLSTLPSIHVVYLYPSDATSRFSSIAPMIQAQLRRSGAYWQASVGMSPRWDERTAADGRRLADITVLRSKVATNRLRDGKMFAQVKDDLTRAGLTDVNKKYLVWVDAPQSGYCGISDLSQDTQRTASNASNRRSVATINRYYDPAGVDFGFCAPVTHELMHAFGAVLAVAPHHDGTGHCNDWGDILCPGPAYDPAVGVGIDNGNDDYFDAAADPKSGSTAKLAWWAVNLNRFLCPPVAFGQLTSDCSQPNVPMY